MQELSASTLGQTVDGIRMTYVTADLHGIREFDRLLSIAGVEPGRDTIIIAGDIIDRGPASMTLLCEVMDAPHIRVLRGNHEALMSDALSPPEIELPWVRQPSQSFCTWLRNGGDVTYIKFMDLSEPQRRMVLDYINGLEEKLLLDEYVVAHAAPPVDGERRTAASGSLWARPPELDSVSIEGGRRILIHGHTPTALEEGGKKGRLYRGKNNRINLDTGLPCLFCVQTGETIYLDI